MNYNCGKITSYCHQLDQSNNKTLGDVGCLRNRIITRMNTAQLSELYVFLETSIGTAKSRLVRDQTVRARRMQALCAVLFTYSLYAFIRIVQIQLEQSQSHQYEPQSTSYFSWTGGVSFSFGIAIILSQTMLYPAFLTENKFDKIGIEILEELSNIKQFSENYSSESLTLQQWYSKFNRSIDV